MKKGIDISQWQSSKSINYDTLAKEIDFAILRIGYTGYGTGKDHHLDNEYLTHYKELSKRNVPLGVYFFGVAMTPEVAKKEAEFTLAEIKKQKLKLEYGVWYDTESSNSTINKIGHQFLNKADLTKVVDTFCKTIEGAGFYCGIYASEYWFTTNLDYNGVLKRYDRWVANWTRKPVIEYGIWQVQSKGKLLGYSGNLDMNEAIKDYPAIYRKMHETVVAPPKPAPVEKVYLVFKHTTTPEQYPDFQAVELKI